MTSHLGLTGWQLGSAGPTEQEMDMTRYQVTEGKNRNWAVLDTTTNALVFESDSRLLTYDKQEELTQRAR
jgi:hypothetical protein